LTFGLSRNARLTVSSWQSGGDLVAVEVVAEDD
jgi:hypothetical protein